MDSKHAATPEVPPPPLPPAPRHCYLALGGNIGAVEETFDRALEQLDALPTVTVGSVSSLVCSPPVGASAGGEFRNAAAQVETSLSPLDLLDRLQAIEHALGRTREVHWGPRTLDIDVILYGAEIVDLPRLRIPHPACWYRRFVLDPLAEIAADTLHPEKGVTIERLRARLLVRPFRFALAGGNATTRAGLLDRLRSEYPHVEFFEWSAEVASIGLEPALLAWLGPESSAEPSAFGSLPRLSRLDASGGGRSAVGFLRDVLRSALGE